MRVLIYGGRDFVPEQRHWDMLDELFADFDVAEEVVVISGRARGADTFGEDWAQQNGAVVDLYPADWKTHDKAAGFIRNQQMLDSGVDYAVEFPGGNGTADMRRRLEKAGVPIWRSR